VSRLVSLSLHLTKVNKSHLLLGTGIKNESSSKNDDNDLPPPIPGLRKQRSFDSVVNEVADSSNLGVEVDVQIAQLTLRAAHLSALKTQVATHRDVRLVFGDRTMQASLLKRAERCEIYKIVGLDYELHFWTKGHDKTPPLPDGYERDYEPGELCANEKWIMRLFEPIRRSFFDGPQPPPLQFIMPTKEYPENCEVATLIGLHPSLNGPYKLVYVFRRWKCVHVYEAVSHGRVWNYTLHLTSDSRYCLREMQPYTGDRRKPMPEWFKYVVFCPLFLYFYLGLSHHQHTHTHIHTYILLHSTYTHTHTNTRIHTYIQVRSRNSISKTS